MRDTFERLQAALPERYTLERKIGHGGMSTVYLARERHPHRRVAVKVLDPAVSLRLGRERFLREIDFVSNLTHPHIVPIFAAGEADGVLFYVMPYVEGDSLSDALVRQQKFSVPTALRIGRDVAGALEYAHRRNVLHRDIKPDNILLHDGYPMVLDFGVARAIKVAGHASITETGLTLGTAAYMGPEQAAGLDDVDGRADIYALGCVLYEMLVGQPPFGKGSPELILPRQIAVRPTPLHEIDRTIPTEVDDAVLTSLAKRREDRYETAGDFANTLDEIRSGLTSGSAVRLSIGLRRRRRRIAGALVAVAAVVALAVTLVLSIRRVEPILAAVPYVDSVAVMPVENLTGEAELDHLADAVSYGAVRTLSQAASLKVSSHLSARAADERGLSIGEIVEALGVRLIVASQFRRVAGEPRLDAELIDGESGRVMRSGSWPVDPSNEQAAERQLVLRLVALVAEDVDVPQALSPAAPMGGPAHDAYLLGKHWLGRRTPAGVRRAIAYFQQAIDLDSTLAPAHEGLATAYMLALVYRYEIGLTGYDAARRALAAANRSIALDPYYAEGYGARGLVTSRSFGPMEDAASDFNRALELSPNTAHTVSWSGAVLAQEGKTEEALVAAQRGTMLDPLAPGRHVSVSLLALRLGEFELAVQAARRATQLEPEILESRALEGRGLVLGGPAEECLSMDFGVHAGVRALCLFALGRGAEAQAVADSVEATFLRGSSDSVYTDVVRADDLAAYYAWTGNVNRAFEWIVRAYELSPTGIDRRVLESQLFDSLRRSGDTHARLTDITDAVWERVVGGGAGGSGPR